MLLLSHAAMPEVIDCPAPRGGHEPRARIAGNAGLRPLLERSDESILREVLGEADVPHDSHETADKPSGLDAPNSFYCAVGFFG
jgi:hypothetical protein